ncbi:MAG: TetR/AcrR family transcriptional regulator, partial [Mycobacteriaceae bacterium]
ARGGARNAVPAPTSDIAARICTATSARDKNTTCDLAITGLQQRMAPVFLALRDAAATDIDAFLWAEIAKRRATNMCMFAADLRATGELRTDLSDDQVADIIGRMNAAECLVLLVRERGWTAEQFTAWLIDAWTRLLFRTP